MGTRYTNYDSSNTLIGDNSSIKATYTNPGGTPVTLAANTVFGRVLASNKVLPMESDASDGTQIPRFILLEETTVAGSATTELTLIRGGRVAREKVVLAREEDTLATAVGTSGTIEDLLYAHGGIELVPGTELTGYDN